VRSNTIRFAVVGAGAVGGVVAWHLAQAGRDPVVIARRETALALDSRGITLWTDGTPRTAQLRATDDPAREGPQDVIFVGFKAYDWQAGLPLVTPLIGPSTLVVPMLNGIPWWYLEGLGGHFGDRRLLSVDPSGEVGAAVPARHVLGCVVYIGANRTAPDQIHWNGRRRLILGEPEGSASLRLKAIVDALCASGLEAEATGDIRSAIWLKLMGNACFNPVSALTGATADLMLNDPALRTVMRAIMLECIAVARMVGVTDLPNAESRLILHPSMVGVKTSMLQDLEAARRLELGAIVDSVCELGRRTGVETPMLAAIGALAASAWQNASHKPGANTRMQPR
jgi:2-dehydropantoate 2-reductase